MNACSKVLLETHELLQVLTLTQKGTEENTLNVAVEKLKVLNWICP